MTLTDISLFLQIAVQMGTPLLLGTLGGILCEKSGHLNLGSEGLMLLGAVIGFFTAYRSANPWLSVLMAGVAGAAGGLLYAVIIVTLQGNHTVTGLAMTIFGTGLSNFMGKSLTTVSLPESVTKALAPFEVPVLSEIPILGDMFFSQSIYVYMSIVIAIILYIYMYKTRAGLNMRMVGENPGAADASGINVTWCKYVNIMLGGCLCGLGGAFYSLVYVPRWQDNITAGAGWIAVALVIFCTWNPLKAIAGAYFFGLLKSMSFKLQNVDINIFGKSIVLMPQFLDMIPYAMTIVVLILITLNNKRENRPPQSLGASYYREDR